MARLPELFLELFFPLGLLAMVLILSVWDLQEAILNGANDLNSVGLRTRNKRANLVRAFGILHYGCVGAAALSRLRR